jgi:sterol desaturase/sphingolipid hydroxylase (fatty acid hydroxylase superfamily)
VSLEYSHEGAAGIGHRSSLTLRHVKLVLYVSGLLLAIEGAAHCVGLLFTVFYSSDPSGLIVYTVAALVGFLITNTAFSLVEYLDNDECTRSLFWKEYIHAFPMWLAYILSAIAASKVGALAVAYFGVQPLVDIGTFKVVAPLVFMFALDFFYYWYHRLSHSMQVLWRVHSVHHAISPVTTWSSYHHVMEEPIKLFFVMIPLSFIVSVPAERILILSGIINAWGQYLHSNSATLALPSWLRHFFADNRYHHLHHSVDSSHHGKNFAAFFPVWDKVFGTQMMPTGNEFPITGIVDAAPARGLVASLVQPFAQVAK